MGITKPSYSWDWFETHTPFKGILERMIDLNIVHERHKIPTIAGWYTINHHYKIFYNWKKFERDFDLIKLKILASNVCRNNNDVYKLVEELECNKHALNDLVLYGCLCLKDRSSSFEWEDISNKE